jgi:hypothetical protein
MLWVALLKAQVTPPQHVPHHFDDGHLHAKETAEAVVFHCHRANLLPCPIHYFPGGTNNSPFTCKTMLARLHYYNDVAICIERG